MYVYKPASDDEIPYRWFEVAGGAMFSLHACVLLDASGALEWPEIGVTGLPGIVLSVIDDIVGFGKAGSAGDNPVSSG